ncbi:MAG: pseudouridine-5'-phosphate glycosidase [Pseudomonadota bacterium]
MNPLPLVLSDDVLAARADNTAIVALESTIITHGMPWPRNVETARLVEQAVRDGGAVPATIAVFDGHIHVGLSDEQLDFLGQAKDVMKLSRADFAYALAAGKTGSTTVAATMLAARLAGIDVFATGGIGGVHAGAETSFDVSADLSELQTTDVIVVCAGAKAILDLPKTLEVLETNGVPVIGYGTEELPAFWSRQSGLAVPLCVEKAQQIADHAAMRARLGMGGGTLVVNPVPQEAEIPRDEMQGHIEKALGEAVDQDVSGKSVTPFLLSRIVELTGGRSLETNVALIVNNARVAADIAVAMGRGPAA